MERSLALLFSARCSGPSPAAISKGSASPRRPGGAAGAARTWIRGPRHAQLVVGELPVPHLGAAATRAAPGPGGGQPAPLVDPALAEDGPARRVRGPLHLRPPPRRLQPDVLRSTALGAAEGKAISEDPFCALVALTRKSDKPVYLVPELFVWERWTRRMKPALMDRVFGSPDTPGFLHSLLSFWRNYQRAQFRVGEPIDLNRSSCRTTRPTPTRCWPGRSADRCTTTSRARPAPSSAPRAGRRNG